MLVDEETVKNTRFHELKDSLKRKHYPTNVIDKAISAARDLTREELLNYKDRQKKTNLTFISTHNPNNANIVKVVRETIPYLQTVECLQKVLCEKQIIFAKRQPQNLKSLLSSAKYTSSTNDCVYSVNKCSINCETCKLLLEGSTVTFYNSDCIFHVKCSFTCTSKNLIYVITCSNCKNQYIGETGRDLRSRMNTHRQQIRDPNLRHLKVSKHIAQCSNGKFTVFPFYQMKVENKTQREAKEQYFIDKFKPELNVD